MFACQVKLNKGGLDQLSELITYLSFESEDLYIPAKELTFKGFKIISHRHFFH